MGLSELQRVLYRLSYNCDIIARIGDNPSGVVLRSWSYSPKVVDLSTIFRLEAMARESVSVIDTEKSIAQIVEWAKPIMNDITEHNILKYYTSSFPKYSCRDFIVFRIFSIQEVVYFICFLYSYSVDCGIDINYIFEKKGLNIRIKMKERGDAIMVYSAVDEPSSTAEPNARPAPAKTISTASITEPTKSLPEFFCKDNTEAIAKIETILPGCKGKKVATIIRALQELGYITLASGEYKSLYRAIRAHYNTDIGADSGITKYLSGSNLIPEIELMNVKKQLQ